MKVHHAEAFIGSSVGRYGNNSMTTSAETSAAAIQVSVPPFRVKREQPCCDRYAACTAAATAAAAVRTSDADGCQNCTVEQQRGRKPRCRSGSWP